MAAGERGLDRTRKDRPPLKCLMSCSAYVQVPPAHFISGTGGFTETLSREGIVPFKSLLVGGGRGLFFCGFRSVGNPPRRERLDNNSSSVWCD